MDGLETLTTRASAMALTGPAPGDADLDRILAAAARAPDHGKLRPWKFILVRGAARERLGRSWPTRSPRATPMRHGRWSRRNGASPCARP